MSKPDRCARCTAKYWWREKRKLKPKRKLQAVGRPCKYPVHVLNIGESMVLDRENLNVLSMKQSVMAYARRHGKQFELRQALEGYKIKRII